MSRRSVMLTVCGLAVAAALLTGVYLPQRGGQRESPAAPITAEIATITRAISAAGAIQPENEVNLKSRISGVLDKLFVTAGQTVKAGDTVARVRLLPDPVSLNTAESAVHTARISLENSEKDFGRAEELFRRKLISEEEHQRAETDLALRREDMNAAKTQLQLLKGGALSRDQDALNMIQATIDGVVLELPLAPGQYVTESNSLNEGSTIAVLADITRLTFRGEVSEADVNELHEGLPVEVSVAALQDLALSGRLSFIAPRGTLKDGAVKFEVRAPVSAPAGSLLRAGFSATGEIVLERRENVVAVPEALLRFGSDQRPYVLLADDSTHFVEIGLSDGFQVEIRSGLSAGDQLRAPE